MKRLLLVGGGHAHALLLRDLVRQPLTGVEVVLVSPQRLAPYSGMVPGWLAGHYRFDQIAVDLPPLAAAAGARWCEGALHTLDAGQRELVLADGRRLGYDLLSLNVGSTLSPPATERAQVLSMRPLDALRTGYERVLARWCDGPDGPDGPDGCGASAASEGSDGAGGTVCTEGPCVPLGAPVPGRGGHRPWTVTAVGGGAAGVESLLAVLARLRAARPDRAVRGQLVSRADTLLPGMSGPAQRAARRALERAGVCLRLSETWHAGLDRGSDLLLWATGAQAHAWQRDPARRGGLAVDEAGFVRIDAWLRSVSHPEVWAVGDCARWAGPSLPKAGVHAVRMGPTLGHNLRVALGGPGVCRRHRPQRQMLALLATGDGRAIASRGPLGAEGAWAWRWKDRIDRRFIAQLQPPFTAGPAPA